MKITSKKILTIFLAVLMLVTAVPLAALNGFAVTDPSVNDLKNVMSTFEQKFSGSTVYYTNMLNAYNAYVAAQAAIDNACKTNDTSGIATAKANLQNAIDQMVAWNQYTGTKANSLNSSNKVFGDWDNNSNDDYKKIYKNVLYVESSANGINSNSQAALNSAGNGYSKYTLDFKFFYPEATLLYDGTTAPQIGAMLSCWGANKPWNWNWNNLRLYSAYIGNTSDLSFAYKWKFRDGRLNHAYIWLTQGDCNMVGTGDQTSIYYTQGSYGASSSQDWYYANVIQVIKAYTVNDGIMSSYNPNFSVRAGSDSGNNLGALGTGNRTIRVFNYKKVIDTMNSNYSKLRNVANYKYGELRSIFSAYESAMVDPNSFFTSSNNYSGCESHYSTAVSNLSASVTPAPKTVNHSDSSYNWTVATAPTCTAQGVENGVCKYCDATTTRSIDALGHELVDHAGQEATCTENGWNAYQTCTRGDYTTYSEIPATGHTYPDTWTVRTQATCGTDGLEFKKCNNCDNEITRDIPATGEHSFVNYTSNNDATCTEDGTKTASCEYNCGVTDTITDVDSKLGHSFVNYTPNNDATCQKNETETAKCERCDETDTREIPDSKDSHRFENYVSNGDATCSADGTKTASCKYNCGETDTIADVGSMDSHRFENYVSNGDATCTEDGTKTSACKYNCGETDTITDVDSKLGHSFVNYTPNNDATCQKNETETAKCERCDVTDTREIPDSKDSHRFENYVSNGDATCTEDGTKTSACKYNCGKTDTIADEGTKLGHNFVNYTSNNDATCQHNATETAKCERCDVTDTREIPDSKDSHRFENYVSNGDATCTADGTKTASCKYNCGETDTIADEGTKLGHSFVNYTPNNDANCQHNATETATCERCDVTDTREIPDSILEHSFTVYVSDENATCENNGTETALCDYNCGTKDERVIENSKLGHDWDSGVVTKEATCNKEGETTFTCNRDGSHIRTEEIAKKPHTPVTDPAVEPTCTSEGKTEGSHCSVCKQVLVAQKVVEKVPHTEVTIPGVAATCTQEGRTDSKYCTACNKIISDSMVIMKAPHVTKTREENHIEATCQNEGSYEIVTYCLNCDFASTKVVVVSKLDHVDKDGDGYCDECHHDLKADAVKNDNCYCHKAEQHAIFKGFYKIILFFWKLFGINKVCVCGAVHY